MTDPRIIFIVSIIVGVLDFGDESLEEGLFLLTINFHGDLTLRCAKHRVTFLIGRLTATSAVVIFQGRVYLDRLVPNLDRDLTGLGRVSKGVIRVSRLYSWLHSVRVTVCYSFLWPGLTGSYPRELLSQIILWSISVCLKYFDSFHGIQRSRLFVHTIDVGELLSRYRLTLMILEQCGWSIGRSDSHLRRYRSLPRQACCEFRACAWLVLPIAATMVHLRWQWALVDSLSIRLAHNYILATTIRLPSFRI